MNKFIEKLRKYRVLRLFFIRFRLFNFGGKQR